MAGKILVADDSKTIRGVFEFVLGKLDHEISICVDGEEAVKEIKKTGFDLIFVDLNMPKMDGFEVIEAARGSRKNAHVPIYVVTTESTEEKKAKARSVGANGWVGKPVKDEVIEKIVANHLG